MLNSSSLLGRFILLAFLLALAVATSAASEPIGYVIYREKGFHPATQARLIEVQSLKAFAAVTKVVTVSGSPIEIQNGQKPEFIPLPAYNPTAGETAKVKIAAALQQYPQHKSKLEEAQKVWVEYSAQYAKVSQESAAPVKQKDKITFTTPDGREFKAVEVTRVDPDGISVLTETSIQKIPFEQLPQPIQQQFRYDPVAAAAFREKITAAKKKVEEAKLAASEKATQSPPSNRVQKAEREDPRSLVFGIADNKAIKAKFGAPDRIEEPSTYVESYAQRLGQKVDEEWLWNYPSLPMKLQDCGIEQMMLGKVRGSPMGTFWVMTGGVDEQAEKRILEFIGGNSDWTRSPKDGMTFYENRPLRLFVSIKSADFRGSRFSEILVMDLDILRMSMSRKLEQKGEATP